MALSTVSALKVILGIPSTDTTQDTQLTAILSAADAALKKWTKRDIEATVYTEYLSGAQTPNLVLANRPVISPRLSATTTASSTSVTGISSTSALIVGMPVAGEGIVAGTTIAAIPSSTTVTLSVAADESGTNTLTFGIEVRADGGGMYGTASGAFPSTAVLDEGVDYALDRSGDGTTSATGVLIRTSGSLTGDYLGWPYGWRRGSLTARLALCWEGGVGNYRVVYSAGYTTIPGDIVNAVHQLAAWLWRYSSEGGVQISSTSYEGYSIAYAALGDRPELGTIRQQLTRYREYAI